MTKINNDDRKPTTIDRVLFGTDGSITLMLNDMLCFPNIEELTASLYTPSNSYVT